jgi:hypothetical protein
MMAERGISVDHASQKVPPGCVPVPPALHPHVEHRAMLIRRAPQPMLLAAEGDHRFVKVPLVASGQRGRPNAPGNIQAELRRPRTVSQVSSTPRAASRSSIMRRLSGKR